MTTPRVSFETTTCARCAGTGQFPSSAWNGVCLGCSGKGRVLTRAGRAAHRRYLAFLASLPRVPVLELREGDQVLEGNRRRTLVADPEQTDSSWSSQVGDEYSEGLLVRIRTQKVDLLVPADATYTRCPRHEAVLEALTHRDGTPYAGVVLS